MCSAGRYAPTSGRGGPSDTRPAPSTPDTRPAPSTPAARSEPPRGPASPAPSGTACTESEREGKGFYRLEKSEIPVGTDKKP